MRLGCVINPHIQQKQIYIAYSATFIKVHCILHMSNESGLYDEVLRVKEHLLNLLFKL